MDYLERMSARLDGREERYPQWLVENKEASRVLAGHVGLKVAERFFRGPLAELPLNDFPRFVLKPEFASTSIGLHLLERLEDGRFRDLITGSVLTGLDVVSACEDVSRRFLPEFDPRASLFVMEEVLEDSSGTFPPSDIRLFAFQGEIGLILVEDHLPPPTRASYFDGNFHPFDDLSDRYGVDPRVAHLEGIVEREPPKNASSILAVARRLSTAIPSSFCRIDLYNTNRGIVLGELTFRPGTFYFKNRKLMSESESARLGALWGAADLRLDGTDFGAPRHLFADGTGE